MGWVTCCLNTAIKKLLTREECILDLHTCTYRQKTQYTHNTHTIHTNVDTDIHRHTERLKHTNINNQEIRISSLKGKLNQDGDIQ